MRLISLVVLASCGGAAFAQTSYKTVACAAAQTASVSYGSYISGCSIGSGATQRFRFSPRHNDEIYFYIRSDVPVTVRLKRQGVADEVFLYRVTDDIVNRTQVIAMPNPNQPEPYEIAVTKTGASTNYSVILDRLTPVSPENRPVQLGQLVTRTLQYNGELHSYAFRVEPPISNGTSERYVIKVRPLVSSQAVCVRVRSERGTLLSTAACPAEFEGTLAEVGLYGIVVFAYDSKESPRYELFVDRIYPASSSAVTISYKVPVLAQSLPSSITERFYSLYSKGGDAGRVTAKALNGTRLPCVRVYDPKGTLLNTANCPNDYAVTLAQAGYYVVRVEAASTAAAQFDLTLVCNTGPCSNTPPPDCFISLSPSSQVFPPEGGRGSFGLISSGTCPYRATSLSEFITLESGAEGTGTAGVMFRVSTNTGADSRQSQVRIQSQNTIQTFTLTQAGRNAFFYGPTEPVRFLARPDNVALLEQNVPIFANRSGLTFNAVASTQSGGNWLSLRQTSGTLPTTLILTVRPQGLRPGRYEGLVTVTSAQVPVISVNVPVVVDFVDAAVPEISIAPRELRLVASRSTPQAVSQLTVRNTGGAEANVSMSALTASFGGWLKVSPERLVIPPGSAVPVTITANTSGLGTGSFAGTVRAQLGEARAEAPVVVAIGSGTETMVLSQSGLTFTAVQDGGQVPSQTFGVLNAGTGVINWTVARPAQEWLSVAPLAGRTDGSEPKVPELEVSVRHEKLDPGEYIGRIEVSSGDIDNSPQILTVVLNVLPRGSDPGPIIRPSGLIFAGYADGSAIPAQTVRVTNITENARDVTASALSFGGNWLTINGQGQTVRPNAPVTASVQVQTRGLAAGIYVGVATFLLSNGLNRTVNVTLLLVPPRGTGTLPSSFRAATGDCVATQLVPQFTEIGGGLDVRVGYSHTVRVRVLDDCLLPVTNGVVTVSFTNGDDTIELANLKNGMYEGSWTPRGSSSGVVQLTARATRDGIAGQVSTGTNGAITEITDPPIFSASDVTPLTPGGIAIINGRNLGGPEPVETSLPRPTEFADTKVTLGRRELPLMRLGAEQIQALVPTDVTLNTPFDLQVRRGRRENAVRVTVAAFAPYLFNAANEKGAISDANPARLGETLTLIGTGFGAVNGDVQVGQAAPEALGLRWRLVVLAGGQEIEPEFAGLMPMTTGIYQARFKLPESSVTVEGRVRIAVRVEDRQSEALALPAR